MLKRAPIETDIGTVSMYSRKCRGDREVLREVMMNDVYGVEALDNTKFEPEVILDIGANIGAFSRLALEYWKGAKVVAWEPHPLSYGLCAQNLRKFSGAELHLGAVSGREITNQFIQISAEAATDAPQCWDLNQAGTKRRPDPENQGYCECGVTHINVVIGNALADASDGQKLLKIDCEGSEFYIIDGVSKENLEKFDVLLMEVHGSQLMIEDYIDAKWDDFRAKILESFDCPELEEWKELTRDHRVIRAFRR